ncbi:UDP-N-acetylmuramate--L-alanine ligase [Tenacibaculum maritimum]|uniref:UDP-N-acetylmuramate--L-alanine ligase n=1 Tax=Tenacibaculum maritimum TaxID=107401 RepID=UPI0012E585BB|nr:UDP-N-acetylmuramate--L-alanine ligase [Tenacibaculum maritimum]MCD9563720.1 UDP-N-acetylmuramate--L-alanine ligase [Tenacibaculum maritimum]MCD9566334.1 UDP-N-acetylmuramate--L-alanine ligase [Tenacibaculum maritimum]MCD9579695.1 UDP-N-acetylmuramate--L-alanine ligase [Tenacibaculum maritimum]MCD9584983.1 UDP-N-acetylmuramate--L-alanine ligase [Tenacibaculum maritimum]MCD9596885.1 UDP-N-acetylmuramate--L-alanine ligase [Tenacibaculum maritimum]
MNLKKIHNIYFIGIGGIGMSAIARYFSANGKMVVGYDKTPTSITSALQKLGIDIHFEDAVENIPISFLDAEKTLVVYTPAISKNHSELSYFIENGFTVLKRAEILGQITQDTFCLAVAGTHGKTTTSSILGHIVAPYKATSFLGGIAENYNSNLILGEDKVSVVEADEFDRSFLQLSPDIACVTSMDADHLDIYGDPDALQQSFKDFAEKVSNTLIVAKGLPLEGLTYAIDEEADYKAFNLRVAQGTYIFDVKTPSSEITNIELNLPGNHNVMNALAALAIADVYGISLEKIKEQLRTFKGVKRRFTYKIKTEDLVLIDDYAHHPTEINAVEKSVRQMYPDEKVLVVFQPHLFSRTQDFADDFAEALSKFDEVILLDIYPARELPIEGIDSHWLLKKINKKHKVVSLQKDLIRRIKESSAKIVTMLGAGDIGIMVDKVREELKNNKK